MLLPQNAKAESAAIYPTHAWHCTAQETGARVTRIKPGPGEMQEAAYSQQHMVLSSRAGPRVITTAPGDDR